MTKHVAQGIVTAQTGQAQASMRKFGSSVKRAGMDVQAADVKTKSFGASLTRLRASAQGVGNQLAGKLGLAGGAMAGAFALNQLSIRAVELSNVNRTLQFSVDEAAKAVDNQTTKFELAKEANRLYAAGVVTTSKEYAKITGLTAKLADATGQDLNTSIKAVSDALVKGNLTRLKAIGITDDATKREEEWARAHGITRKEMTTSQKSQAALEEFLEQAEAKSAKLTGSTMTLAHEFQALKNQAIDLGDSIVTLDTKIKELANEFRSLTGRTLVEAEQARTRRWRIFVGVVTLGISEVLRLNRTMEEASRLGPRVTAAAEEALAARQAGIRGLEGVEGSAAEGMRRAREEREAAIARDEARAENERRAMVAAREGGGAEGRAEAARQRSGGGRGGGAGRGRDGSFIDRFLEDNASQFEGQPGALEELLASDEFLDERGKRMEQFAEKQRLLALERQELGRKEAAQEAKLHADKIERMEIEMAKEREHQKVVEQTTRATTDALAGAAFAAADASEQKGKVFVKEIEEFAKSRGRLLITESLFQLAMAAVSAAGLQPVKAAAHLSAAGIAAAQGAAWLAGSAGLGGIAAGMGGGGGGRGSSRPAIGEGAGRGGGFGPTGRDRLPTQRSESERADSDIPLSSTQRQRARAPRDGDGRPSLTIQINNPLTTKEEAGRWVHEAMRAWERQGAMA